MSLTQREAMDIADTVIVQIAETLQPEDVFSEDALIEWAQDKEPQDVFEEKELASWAEANGYVKE